MGTNIAIRDDRHYLVVCSEIRTLVERIETVEEAKDLADRAAAAKKWAERARLGDEQINLATIAKLWAERRAGEILAAMRSGGELRDGRPSKRSSTTTVLPSEISKDQSAQWQKLAAVEDFESAIGEVAADGRVTADKVLRVANGRNSYRSSPPEALHDTKREIRSLWDRATIFNQYDIRENLRKMQVRERDELVERMLEAKRALDAAIEQAVSIRNEGVLLKLAPEKEVS